MRSSILNNLCLINIFLFTSLLFLGIVGHLNILYKLSYYILVVSDYFIDMGRKTIGEEAMTAKERKRRSRAMNPNSKVMEAAKKKEKRRDLKDRGG